MFQSVIVFGIATPDEMRGRVGAVNFLFINASNQLGAFESGATAALFGTIPSAVIGGVGSVIVALLWMKLFPALRNVDRAAECGSDGVKIRKGFFLKKRTKNFF